MIDYKKYIPSKNTLIFIGVLVFLLIFLQQCNSNSKLKRELENTKKISERTFNNYKASLDTLRIVRGQNGQLIAERLSYVYDINSLTDENKKQIEQYKEALDLNKKLKGVNSLLSAQLKIKEQIINSKNDVVKVNDSIYKINFSDSKNWDKYNWRQFNASLDIKSSKNDLSVIGSDFNWKQGVQLKAAVLEENGINTLRITSSYPGLEFTDIENISLVNDKLNQKPVKKTGWSVGIGAGFGLNLTPNQVITVGPQIGIGLYWSPKWLRF
jgi:hypothetical protein